MTTSDGSVSGGWGLGDITRIGGGIQVVMGLGEGLGEGLDNEA